ALDNHNASMNFSILKNSEIWGGNDHNNTLDAAKAEQKLDPASKEAYKKILLPCHGRQALQDLTNVSIRSDISLPKSPNAVEENSAGPSRRRATVCYREPSLKSKLRRGDQFTDTQFLDSCINRVKNKRSFKSKSKF
ncbi:Shugoshin-like 1, partial [Merops nubicus]